jgi:diguanylate cyclase (GGDEF)-like protein
MAIASAPPSAASRLLVVDDNPDHLSLAVSYLEGPQFEVAVATSGRAALTSLEFIFPQLILLDVMLPDYSGFELCRRLKQQPQYNHVPVIFMTSLDNPQSKAEGFQAGGVDYITKPLEQLEFLARVETHLRLFNHAESLQAQNQSLQQESQALEIQNQTVLAENRKLAQLVHIDELTQVGNRRCFDQRLREEWLRLRRSRQPLSLILFDIDYFKAYNDRYGHPAGDACLTQLAQTIKRLLKRPGDILTRYGGEEFAIILPNVNVNGALYMADRIQAELKRLALPHESSQVSPYLTVTQGISTIVPQLDTPISQLIESADQALYLAKQQGRNQSVHRLQQDLTQPSSP